jgi:hypothetical protein
MEVCQVKLRNRLSRRKKCAFVESKYETYYAMGIYNYVDFLLLLSQ